MKLKNLRLFISSLILMNSIKLLAYRSDYGRDYSMRDFDNTDASLFFYLLFIIAIIVFIIFIWIRNILDRVKENNNSKRNYNNYSTKTCPCCNGRGWIRGKLIYSGFDTSYLESKKKTCYHCNGYGRILSPKAEILISKLKGMTISEEEAERRREEEAERRREEEAERRRKEEIERKKKEKERLQLLQEEKKKYMEAQMLNKSQGKKYFISSDLRISQDDYFKKLMEHVNNRNNIVHEIKNIISHCQLCTHCNGKDNSCPYCKGFGRVFNNEANNLYKKLLESRYEWLQFRKGYLLFSLDAIDEKDAAQKSTSGMRINFDILGFHFPYLGLDQTFDSLKREIISSLKNEEINENVDPTIKELILELKNAPTCRFCEGAGVVPIYTNDQIIKVEGEYGYNYYIKEKCKQCNGTGIIS